MTQNAVRLQIWVAISAYLLVAIAKKKLGVKASLHEILQTISLTPFDKVPLQELFMKHDTPFGMIDDENDTLNLLYES